jgi:CDP-diacylglycerol pyrophosphatase
MGPESITKYTEAIMVKITIRKQTTSQTSGKLKRKSTKVLKKTLLVHCYVNAWRNKNSSPCYDLKIEVCVLKTIHSIIKN